MNNHSVVYLQHMCFSSNNHRDQVHRGEDEIFNGRENGTRTYRDEE